MNLFITMLLAVLVACAGFFLGILCFHVGSKRGPQGAYAASVVGSVISVAMGIALGHANQDWIIGSLAGALCTLSNTITVWLLAKRLIPGVDYAINLPQATCSFGLANFELMDTSGKGHLTVEDLRSYRRSPLLSEDDIEIISYMLEHMSEIGHYIGSYQTELAVHKRWSKRIRSTPTTLTVITSVYGISRHDLQSYPQRAKAKAKRKLG